MTTGSLNLLRYPARMPWHAPAWLRPVLEGVLAGVLAGAVWAHGAWQQRDALLKLREQLQAQWQDLTRQQAKTLAQQAQVRLHQAVLDRAQEWQSQRRSMLQLHAVLAAQADTGLRVERWQFDGHSLVLQAWLPAAERVPQLMAALSAAWPQAWVLQELGQATGSQAGVALSLQAPLKATP